MSHYNHTIKLVTVLYFRYLLGRHAAAMEAYDEANMLQPQDWVGIATTFSSHSDMYAL